MSDAAFGIALTVVGLMVAIASRLGPHRRDDLRWVGDELAATAPAWRIALGGFGLGGIALGGVLRLMASPDPGLADLIFPLLAGVAAILVIASVIRPEQLRIGWHGVTLRNFFLNRTVPWERIESDDFALADAGLRGIAVHGQQRWGFRPTVHLGRLAADPQRVLDLIVYYRDHPELRGGGDGTATPARLAAAPSQYIPPSQ